MSEYSPIQYHDQRDAEIERLRAELAAERERAEELKMMLKENGETLGEFVASNKEAWDRAHNTEASAAKLREALVKCEETLGHARVFITSREKMHPVGVDIFDEVSASARAVLAETGDRDE